MRCLFSLLFLSLFLSCFSQENLNQRHLNFDDNWKFQLGNASDPAKDFNYKLVTIFSKTGAAPNTAIDPKFNDAAWRTLDLPHDWAVELPFVNSTSFDVMAHGYKP